MSLEEAVSDSNDEPFFTNWKVTLKEGTREAFKASLDAIVAPIVHAEDPRTGVITYAYSQSEQDGNDKNQIYFTEMFTDVDSFSTHLTEAEGEAVVKIFECVQDRVMGYINPPLWHQGVREGITSNQGVAVRTTVGHVFTPYPKSLLGGKWGRRLCPSIGESVMLELRVDTTKEVADRLVTLLTPLTKITKTDMNTISAHIVRGKGWWRRDPSVTSQINLKTRDAKIPAAAYTKDFGDDNTVEFRAIYSHCNIRHLYGRALVQELVELLQSSNKSEFIVTAPNLQHENLVEVLEYFQDNGLVTTDMRSLLSGFLIHPYFTKDWTGKDVASKEEASQKKEQASEKKGQAFKNKLAVALAKSAAPVASTSSSSSPSTDDEIFKVRKHPIKNIPEAVVLEKRARSCPSTEDYFVVPLLDYLRSATRLGHNDKEVPIGTLFGILERMRAMARDVSYINSLVEMTETQREEQGNLTLVQQIFHKLSLMGRGEYQENFGSKKLKVDGLSALIEALEKEYSQIVTKAKEAVASGAAMEYLGLQELYSIGSVVTTRSIPGLGGLAVSFKVVDCMYEPIRSLMGSLRYSFRVTLETIVNAGQHFVAVPFTEVIGDWKNVKEQANLPFQRIQGSSEWIKERIGKMNSLEISESSVPYMDYPSGSFFPSLGSRNSNKSSGASSSSIMRAAAGQAIIDIRTGLNLGYAPASRTGELGIAMGYIMKFYLDFIRKATHANVTVQEINKSGYFTAYDKFPQGVNAQPWPCVIGFSMTTKSWGYVVVDGLRPVLPDPRPWSQLVLPDSSREMLMSLAELKIQGSNSSRYKYDDVIAGKGSGGLYLLYGPPGCGKTLTVEALAAYFGKPLYSISFAELGSSTAELEEKLTETLGLASQWGSLVLLDEGDALVEKRKQGQLLLNSMTGVLLRLLETFEGSLFINSNRVSSFDPAALSRVTLAVKFAPLGKDGMQQIWRNTIARVLCSDTTQSLSYEEALALTDSSFDLPKLAEFPGSGRSVGAVMKMAIALCSYRKCDLSDELLGECVNNFLSFHNDLKDEGATEEWDK